MKTMTIMKLFSRLLAPALVTLAALTASATPLALSTKTLQCSLDPKFDIRSADADHVTAQVALIYFDRHAGFYRLEISSESAALPMTYFLTDFSWKQETIKASDERAGAKLSISLNRSYSMFQGELVLDGQFVYQINCRTKH